MNQQIVILASASITDHQRRIRRLVTVFIASAMLFVLSPASALADGTGPCSADVDCINSNACTTGVCVNGTCQQNANSDPCDDGLACTVEDVCGAGICTGTPSCPEGTNCNMLSGVCMLHDADNDGMPDVSDPCVNDPRNSCYGPITTDEATGQAIRVNANVSGAECYGTKTDCNGDVWYRDYGFNVSAHSEVCGLGGGGEGCVIAGIASIFGCDDEATEDLFQCGHWDGAAAPELAYTFSVPANNYLVNLYFANVFTGTGEPGDRIFDIAIEGDVVYDDFDQIVAAGADGTAVVRSAIVSVTDGTLDIELLHEIENPTLKAIEILEAGECITDADCDDANACNGVETCQQWTCMAGTAPVCDDGEFCNGGETCDAAAGCVAGTVVDCSDGIACTVDACDEILDACVNSTSDAICDDTLFCNGAETCDATLDCQAGEAPMTDDGVACTVDSCDEAADAIVNASDDSLCDDGEFCNGAETCDATLDCQAGEAPVADDGVACTVDSCDEAADTIVNASDDSLCDDGEFCNGAETCDAELDCQAGEAPTTDDGVACTLDSCDEAADAIVNVSDDSLCDDGEFCNGAETCDATLDCQGGERTCDDGIDCTVDACDEIADACTATPDDTVCDDGAVCSGAETCSADAGCVAGTVPDCSDLDSACTVGSCSEEAGGCQALPVNEGQVCGDATDACTLELVCLEGECVDVPLCDPDCEMCEGEGVCRSLCGNPFAPETEEVSVIDALFSLRAAVGLETCSMCKCDVTGDHAITSSDTLMLMHYVIGCDAEMSCPMPGDTTTTTVVEPTSTTMDYTTTTTFLLD